MADVFILYPLAWLLFMGLGFTGYIITKGAASGYFLTQLLAVAMVLFLFRESFGIVDGNLWMMYAVGFASYVVAFLLGASTREIQWVVTLQIVFFVVTYLSLPWLFGFIG